MQDRRRPRVPGQTLADFATDSGTKVIVTGFTQDLDYGVSIPMTFSFATAGTLSLNIPIQLPPERSTDRETVDDPAAAPDAHLGRGRARRGGAGEATEPALTPTARQHRGRGGRPAADRGSVLSRPVRAGFRTTVGPPVYGSRHEINHA